MTRKIHTVPQHENPSIAARIMRSHSIHHVGVTLEGRVAGTLSSFDRLELVEERRFVSRQRPEPRARGPGPRKRDEG